MIRSILIVDDCRTTRKIIASYLKGAGYNMITAANGVEAIEKLVGTKVDFVITDLNMPQMDGIELLRWIRSNATFRHLPLAILTTDQADLSRVKAISTGASAYLTKPITKELLINEVRQIAEANKVGILLDLKIKILVVDDFSTIRRIVKNILKQIGYTDIDEAEDGNGALAKLRQYQYDLMVSDWNMPDMTGLDLLKAIRTDSALSGIPVLIVTAEAKKEDVVEAIKAGVNNYIVKPFTAEALREKIEKIFDGK